MRTITTALAVVCIAALAAGLSWAGGAKEPAGAEKITLNVWHLWPDPKVDADGAHFNAALAIWKPQHPNIEVNVDATTNDLYKPKIQTALAAGQAPDVFFMFGAAFAKPFADGGKIVDLTPYLDADFKSKMLPGSAVFMTFDDKIYGLPLGSYTAWLYVNRDMFQENGISYPKTFDQLVDVVKAFKAKGIVPFTLGNKLRWPIILIYESLVVRHGGQREILKEIYNGKMTDPAFLQAAQDIKTLVDAGAFRPDELGIDYDQGFNAFKTGKSPMYYMGSWQIGAMEGSDSPINGKIDAIRFPSVAGGKGSELDTWGGAFSFYCASPSSKHLKEAVQFVKDIAVLHNKDGVLTSGVSPCYRFDIDPSQIKSDISKQVLKLIDKSTSYTIGWDLLLEQKAAQNYLDNICALLGGFKTPEQFVATLPGN